MAILRGLFLRFCKRHQRKPPTRHRQCPAGSAPPAGAAPRTRAKRRGGSERRRTGRCGAGRAAPVTVSSLLLCRGKLLQAPLAPMPTPVGPRSSSPVPRAPRLLCRWSGSLWKPYGQVTHLFWGLALRASFLLCSWHPRFFSPATTCQLILPSASIMTASLPPLNTGTWQQFLETRTVVANIGRIMPTMRHYFQETTTVVAWGRPHSGHTLQLFKPSS